MAKERFSSAKGFIISSVGAAVGLGNALRFPALCAKFGGGTFLLVYFFALAALGLPLLASEIALGRKSGGGAPKSFASLSPKLEGLGWASSFNSLAVAVIYAGLIGWILAMAFKCFPLAYSGGENAESYFFSQVLNARSDGVISSISPLVAACVALVWIMIFICLSGGVKRLSRAAEYSVFLPVAILAALAVRGFFYPRCGQALAALFVPRLSALASPELWLTALSQVFFSLSVAVGIMPAFGACLPEKCNVVKCSAIIAAADFGVSLLSSIVFFTTLYGNGLEGKLTADGINAAFEVYPVALCGVFGGNKFLNGACGVAFYLSLAFMAVQSAASMTEAALSPLCDKFGLDKRKAAAITSTAAFAPCILFATSAAPALADIGDRFCNYYLLLALGAAECLALGRTSAGRGLIREINLYCGRFRMPAKPYAAAIGFFCPAVLCAVAVWAVYGLAAAGGRYGGYPFWTQFAFGWLPVFLCAISGYIVAFFARPRAVKRKFS